MAFNKFSKKRVAYSDRKCWSDYRNLVGGRWPSAKILYDQKKQSQRGLPNLMLPPGWNQLTENSHSIALLNQWLIKTSSMSMIKVKHIPRILFLVEGTHSTLSGEREGYVRKRAILLWSSFGSRIRRFRRLGTAGRGGSLSQRSQRTIKTLGWHGATSTWPRGTAPPWRVNACFPIHQILSLNS